MYESFYQLNKRPFSATPDASCCFQTKGASLALAELKRCAEHGQGIGLLTAPPGTGKTVLCRKLQSELGGRFKTVFLGTGNFSTRRALLQALLYELGQPYTGMDEQELRLEFLSAARSVVPRYDGLVLIFDEAHVLGERLLEEIRTIADLSLDGRPLVRVILSGQLRLEETLVSPTLEAFNQRIAAQVNLEPFSRQETLDYIAYRLEWAGGECGGIFTPAALDLIARACDGLPRSINQLCDHCLLLAFVADAAAVEVGTVRDALADLKQLPLHWNVAALPEAGRDAHGPAAGHEPLTEHELALEEDGLAELEETLPSSESLSDAVSFEIGAQLETNETIDHPVEQPASYDPQAELPPIIDRLIDSARGASDSPSMFAELSPGALGEVREHFRASRPGAEFEEEQVYDRYATLDAGRPFTPPPEPPRAASRAKPRTEPSQPPEQRRTDRQAHAPHSIARPQGEVHFRDSFSVSLPPLNSGNPDELVNSLIPLIEQAQKLSVGPEIYSTDAGAAPPLPHTAEGVDVSSRSPLVEADDESLEERIGSSVLELCLDTQNAMFQGATDIRNPEPQAESTLDTSPRVTRFDIVEPELAVPSPQFESHDDRPPPRHSTPSSVPTPNYKTVFSTLRRRHMKRA